jgi:hypothetical protein
MLCHGEVRMYLLAINSFVRQLGRSPQVVVLNDGSLTDSDVSLLNKQIPSLRLFHISTVDTAPSPKGGCWERLMLIGDLVQNSYIVQLDSDTLTLGPIPEVIDCIERNQSFTLLGDRSYPHIESMLDACTRLKSNVQPQVQSICERSFDLLPESRDLKYLRGNAGFVGFGKGSINPERIQWFSGLMRRLAHNQWNEWGSEQLTSNLLIANSDNPLPLPSPRYVSYWAHLDIRYEDAAFIHFIGPHRYANGFYVRGAKRALKLLC